MPFISNTVVRRIYLRLNQIDLYISENVFDALVTKSNRFLKFSKCSLQILANHLKNIIWLKPRVPEEAVFKTVPTKKKPKFV